MNAKRPLSFALLLLISVLLAGCNYPGLEPTTQPATGMEYTQAAQTVVARLTQSAAETGAATGESTASPQPDTASVTPQPPILPTETPTITPTSSPSPTPTLMPEDPRLELGAPDWQASFADDSDWFTFDEPAASFQVEDDRLVMVAKSTQAYENWSLSWPKLTDFYLEYTITTGEQCAGEDRYGIIARAPDPNAGYLVGLSCNGAWRLRAWDGEDFHELADWTPSGYINTGPEATNRLGLMANGNDLSVYINGHLVGEEEDGRFEEGKFGAFIAAEQTPDFTVYLSEAMYWALP
jgi:hypothetical protein